MVDLYFSFSPVIRTEWDFYLFIYFFTIHICSGFGAPEVEQNLFPTPSPPPLSPPKHMTLSKKIFTNQNTYLTPTTPSGSPVPPHSLPLVHRLRSFSIQERSFEVGSVGALCVSERGGEQIISGWGGGGLVIHTDKYLQFQKNP